MFNPKWTWGKHTWHHFLTLMNTVPHLLINYNQFSPQQSHVFVILHIPYGETPILIKVKTKDWEKRKAMLINVRIWHYSCCLKVHSTNVATYHNHTKELNKNFTRILLFSSSITYQKINSGLNSSHCFLSWLRGQFLLRHLMVRLLHNCQGKILITCKYWD